MCMCGGVQERSVVVYVRVPEVRVCVSQVLKVTAVSL
jgi:hypothetical protein